MLFLCSERDFFADSGEHLRGDAKALGFAACYHRDARTRRGPARQDAQQFRGNAAAATHSVRGLWHDRSRGSWRGHSGGYHCLDRSLRWTTVEAGGIVARKLALEREPGNMLPVVADAIQILRVFRFHLDLSALKPGEDYAHRAKVCPISRATYSDLGKPSPKFGARNPGER